MNKLIQFELLVCSPKPTRLGNKPCYMPCLTAASNAFFCVVELQVFLLFFSLFSILEKSITPHSLESQTVSIIKYQFGSPTVATQQLAWQQHVRRPVSHTEE